VRYRAKNIFGWGSYSESAHIETIMVPDAPDPVVTEVLGDKVKISWLEPADNGSAITTYNVLILAGNSLTLVDDGVYCSSVTTLYCEIPMSVLTQPLPNGQFLLQLGALVQAKVRAVNGLGAGNYSTLNTDTSPGVALVQTIPSTPTLAPKRFESTSTTTQITVEIPSYTDNSDEAGGTAVTSYALEWNSGFGTTFTEIVGGPVGADNLNLFINVATSSGNTYLFRYRVRNIYGWSPNYSPVASLLSAKAPDTPATASTQI
jgi:hypothetical protein